MPTQQYTRCDAAEHITTVSPEASSSCGDATAPLDRHAAQPIAFDFLSTPKDAWLLVPEHLIIAMLPGFAPTSPLTRQSETRVYALAEEPDAIRFMDA